MHRLRAAFAIVAIASSPGIARAAKATPTPAPALIPIESAAPAPLPSQPSFGTFSVETPAPAAPVSASPAPTASGPAVPSAAPAAGLAAPGPISTSLVEDPAISQRAREWLLRVQSNEIDRRQIDAKFNAEISNADFKRFSQQITSFGTLVSFTFVGSATYSEGVVYEYAAHFATTPGHWFFAIDNEGKIGGMRVTAIRP